MSDESPQDILTPRPRRKPKKPRAPRVVKPRTYRVQQLNQDASWTDLATGDGQADSRRLADTFETTKNSIEVSRVKARQRIRDELRGKGHFQDQQRIKR